MVVAVRDNVIDAAADAHPAWVVVVVAFTIPVWLVWSYESTWVSRTRRA
jgi:hypothetical protein